MESTPLSPTGDIHSIHREGKRDIIPSNVNDESQIVSSPEQEQAPQVSRTGRFVFGLSTVVLLAMVLGGLFWIFLLSPTSPVGFGWYLFSFAAGLSMIVLPCTLPLAFVIVPLAMGKGYAKGLGTALAFGLGVAITLSMYGILAAILGKAVFAFSGGGGAVIKNIFYAIGGIIAILFALGELGLIKFALPTYGGAAPAIIQKRKDLLKPFLLGLFLGNIGVGCPHPATPIILGQIGITGDVFYGWLLFFVHAIGRIVPLLVLAMFGIMGVNATKALIAHKDSIARVTAWGMVFVGSFLFTLGFFSHDWWVYSGTHSILEEITQEQRFTGILSERFQVAAPHLHGLGEIEGKTGFFGAPLWMGNVVLVALFVIPMGWYWFRERRKAKILQETERAPRRKLLHWQGAFILVASFLLGLVFIYVVPHWFLAHKALEREKAPLVEVALETNPEAPLPGALTQLTFSLKDEKGNPLQGLKIDHDRILHTIIVHEDFEIFAHIHPEDRGPVSAQMIEQAMFSVNYVFPRGGRYLIAIDYLHEAHQGAKQFLLDVGERGTPVLLKDFTRKKQVLTTLDSGYTVSLTTNPSVIRAGEEASLRFRVEDLNGLAVTDLEPYLVAPLHLATIRMDLASFAHSHGEIHDPLTGEGRHELKADERFGPEIEAHVMFPSSGLYQVFGQFQRQGRVTQVRFLVEVGKAGDLEGESRPMEAHGH